MQKNENSMKNQKIIKNVLRDFYRTKWSSKKDIIIIEYKKSIDRWNSTLSKAEQRTKNKVKKKNWRLERENVGYQSRNYS